MRSISFALPWPPSVNHYWMRSGKRVYMSRDGREYKAQVIHRLAHYAGTFGSGLVSVRALLFPPTGRRVGDIDNYMKALLDGIEAAGVIDNDSQVKRLDVEMCDRVDGGRVLVMISQYKGGCDDV